MRVFYVVYVTDYGLRRSIDAIRLLADPSVKWPAHITVRGPYEQTQDFDRLSETIRGKVIKINGCGRFYETSQNTVYLSCHSPVLITVWDKPGLGFTPHLTLYDGTSREFANSLINIICSHVIELDFIADGLSELISGNGGKELCPCCIFGSNQIEAIIGVRLSPESLHSLDKSTRLIYIERLWKYIIKYHGRFPVPVSDCLSPSEPDGVCP